MNTKRILISGVAVWIVSALFGWVTCGWLFNWVYQLPPNIWKAPEVMASNLIWMNLIGLLTAIIFALVFALLHKGIPKKGVERPCVRLYSLASKRIFRNNNNAVLYDNINNSSCLLDNAGLSNQFG